MDKNIYIYIIIMGVVSYLIRALPMTLLRKPIKNRFIKSFLYYVPYVTLAVMTFPAIINATQSPISGILALIVGIVTAAFGFNLIKVAVSCCVTVFVSELVLINLLHMV
ncbi:MAG: AzlD domain-containing protein [Clostridia bacterium]|nr:AzlD domain-containing protein [Clostridia bacterium]